MGMLCPICGTHQPFTRNLTVDGKPAVHSDDVIARELGCGHVIGGDSYREFMAACNKIDVTAAQRIVAIKNKAREDKAAAWRTLIPVPEVD